MISKKWLSVVAASSLLAVSVAACGDDSSDDSTTGGAASSDLSGEIAGAGSSAQEAAQEAWIAGFQDANPDTTISYDPIGSGGGREQFISGGVAYAGSDASLEAEELTGAEDRCGGPDNLVQVPDYVSPIAIIYNLPGVDTLQLTPDTLAQIFNQDITEWSDEAIAAENPDVDLPDTRITPVNRSDESGTTENFVDYLSQIAPDVWSYEVDGNWPVDGGEAASGTSGVVEAVGAGEGAIGYADASQAGDLGVATLQVGEEYVGPSAEAAAKIVEVSPKADVGGGQYVFAYSIDRTTTESGVYPIVLVSYLIACTTYDDASEGAITGAYITYAVSPEGQEAAAGNAGSAPISESTQSDIESAVAAIGAS